MDDIQWKLLQATIKIWAQKAIILKIDDEHDSNNDDENKNFLWKHWEKVTRSVNRTGPSVG